MDERKNAIPITSLILGGIGFILNASASIYDSTIIGVGIILTFIALICGIVSLVSQKQKKVCAIIGIVFCAISVVAFNNWSNKKSEYELNLAQYNAKTYTITFDTDGGQEITPMIVHPNTYLKAVVPYKEGYEFSAWTLDGKVFEFTGYVNERITSDVTLKANYIQKVTKVVGATDGEDLSKYSPSKPNTSSNSNNSSNKTTSGSSNNSSSKPTTSGSSNSSSSKPTTSGSSNNSTSKPNTSNTYGYQQIYDEYAKKLKNAGPTSSISEMAEILNEGVTKMAEYMFSAKGTDGQYATYQSWVNKIYEVYMNNVR